MKLLQFVSIFKSSNINNIGCFGGLAESLTAGGGVAVSLSVFCTELSNSCLGFLPHSNNCCFTKNTDNFVFLDINRSRGAFANTNSSFIFTVGERSLVEFVVLFYPALGA